MAHPKLKRIKVSTCDELRTWLTNNPAQDKDVMIVTCNHTSKDKHIRRSDVLTALEGSSWAAGRSYSLIGNLEGHVITKAT